jgi:gliding motility-associated-like protein
LNSNKIWIDDVAPSAIEPDSVSVNMLTQLVFGGWTTPSDADIMGYSLFKVDPVSGSNSVIDEKNVLTYTFVTTTFNSTTSGNKLAIAAFDSCRNGGVISAYHSPILLSVSTPTNYRCQKKINLSWTPYVGWNTDSNYLFIFDLTLNKCIQCIRLSGITTSYIYSLPYLNTTFAFMVRSKRTGKNITSSSNIVSSYVPDFPKPITKTTLSQVSVEFPSQIQALGNWETGDSATLYVRQQGAGIWSNTISYNKALNSFTYNDITHNSDYTIAEFLLVRYNSCGNAADSSALHNNILLTEGASKKINWNSYNGWTKEGIPYAYNIEKWNGSTWNTIGNTSAQTFALNGTGYGVTKYRVTAKPNNPSKTEWSHSNEIQIDLGYDSSAYDTTLIPSGFTPDGINPIFKMSNPAISPGEAIMQIYNRWGELIFKGDALTGWDGKSQDQPVQEGLYIYIIEAKYRNKREVSRGTINLIR